MNKTFACLTAAVIVSLATSMAATQASADDVEHEFHATFHQHVATANIAPVWVEAHLQTGGVMPEGVVLHAVPDAVVAAAPDLEAHRYVVSADRIHIVHPTTREVMGVINR